MVLKHQSALEKRVRQHSILVDIGKRAISSDLVTDEGSALAEGVADGLGADCVILTCSNGDTNEVVAGWDRESGETKAQGFPVDELRAVSEACEQFEAAGGPLPSQSTELIRRGFGSALVVHFESAEIGSWSLGALFRNGGEPDEDDRYFLGAMGRIIYSCLVRQDKDRRIRESEAELSMFVNQLPAILWSTDADLIIQSTTGSGLRLLGLPPNRSVGRRVDEMVPPEAAKVIADAANGNSGSYVVEMNGRLLQSWVEPMRASDGEILGVIGLLIDITEQEQGRALLEQTKNDLEEERSQLRLFLEQLPAILIKLDRHLIIQSSVGAGLSAIGSWRDKTVGWHLSELIDADSPAYTAFQNALDGTSGDVTQQYNDRLFRVHVEPLRDFDRKSIIGVVGMSIDVTEEMRAQDDLFEKTQAVEALPAQLIAAQEAERERIAREIHDVFGEVFTSLRFDASWIRENAAAADPETLRKRALKMGVRIDEGMRHARERARELRPKVLDDFGLVPAIEDLVELFSSQYGIETNLSGRPEEISLGNGLDIMLYRIVQEALTNVAQHSGATRAEVRLRTSADYLTAEIRDDGCGIPPDEIGRHGSLGIRGMRERAEIIGGHLVIEPYEGKGTIVRVVVPIRREAS